jgi:hypothetical protein
MPPTEPAGESFSPMVRGLAHARAGDKGDVSNVGVLAYDELCYEVLRDTLTEAVVARELDDLVEGDVTRYDLPNIDGFNFVLEGALDGGATRTLRVDRLGKSMSSAVLGIELDATVPEEFWESDHLSTLVDEESR